MNLSWLFPYRTHLEEEIEYLKSQLAQRDRQIHALQDILANRLKPVVEARVPKEAGGKIPSVTPKGWDAYRAARRANPDPEPEPAKETVNV